MTPIVKAWCTDMAVDVTSVGVQVHGGMGFDEETGAAQLYRDARILPIYEGTNGIQAADFVFRKVLFDKGAVAKEFIAELKSVLPKEHVQPIDDATNLILEAGQAKDLDRVAWLSVPYLNAFSYALGAYYLAKAVDKNPEFVFSNGITCADMAEFYNAAYMHTLKVS